MGTQPQIVALVGVGNLGKYVCEQLISNDRFDVVVISRKANLDHFASMSNWLETRKVNVYQSDYSEESVLSILNSTKASTLISFINCPYGDYVAIHLALFNACLKSKACKRLIPSEWVGNIEAYPLLPRFYGASREPFRKFLRESRGVEWTLFNGGWLMDYFLPKQKTYMSPIPDEFPVDPNNWRACIRGSGDELQAWTCARDIGKAVVELLAAHEWEPVTYVVGQWGTFNEAINIMERYYNDSLQKYYKSAQEIKNFIDEHEDDGNTPELEIALVDEWMISGASACPREKTLSQRAKYFSNTKFATLEELLKLAEKVDFV